jgi:hypothetical protein
MPLNDPDNPLAAEILAETAASYFAACKKMVACLEALKAFDRAHASVHRSSEDVAHRSDLVADAAEGVYSVVVQREAMMLSHYEGFWDDYEVSPEVRARVGPRRRSVDSPHENNA